MVADGQAKQCIHEQLPESVDRILYVDAGDLLILGDIAPFYNDDFDGNLILAANIKRNIGGKSLVYENKDLSDPEKFMYILEGSFNSGSYMINIKKFRQIGIGIDFYLDVVETCKTVIGEDNHKIYWGDQGLLSVCFAGYIKYWGYPECKFMPTSPYNFMMGWYGIFDIEPPYNPTIVHYVACEKPWKYRYNENGNCLSGFNVSNELVSLNRTKPGVERWLRIWYEYALATE